MQQHFIRRIHRRPACQRVRRNHRQEQQQQLYISTLHQQQQQQPFDSSVTILFATNKWQEKRDDHGAWEMTNHQQQQPAPPPHYCHYHPLVCRQFNLQLGKQQMLSLATALIYCFSLAGVFLYQQMEQVSHVLLLNNNT